MPITGAQFPGSWQHWRSGPRDSSGKKSGASRFTPLVPESQEQGLGLSQHYEAAPTYHVQNLPFPPASQWEVLVERTFWSWGWRGG